MRDQLAPIRRVRPGKRICPWIILFTRDSILRLHATRAHTRFHSIFVPIITNRVLYIWSYTYGNVPDHRGQQPTQEFIAGDQYDHRLVLLCLLLPLLLATGLQQRPFIHLRTHLSRWGRAYCGEMTHHPLLAGHQPARGYVMSEDIINLDLIQLKAKKLRLTKLRVIWF